MFENDYIMKLIKSALNGIVSFIKKKSGIEDNIDEESGNVIIAEDQLLEMMIKRYVSDGEINKAENALFEAMQTRKSPRLLELALNFYDEISKWSEEKLSNCNFSRMEILQGLNEVKQLYGAEIF
ncbi:hypothetical protein JK636_12235 [Clostridium sp. YIM B02515]|uniref:Uncharacterized protein n=1 Tax=Clostridium rhizosphaerae TaxID=2803861 RepID=A0ABS1TAZ1_9CLOT|nr:DUF6483 family protein [Clostridium rhizosphaerae]MBL4936526.1 hypothetical protein [Clostridium rhizosphaerae]